ncbi:4281_t:CDS:2 [Ambispora gerdemannii]|uniref:4281_t:CDS:1 n=1 Tax=Ambispora gerdemannii TaxID=144530 RepID=A0A9N8VAA3_9GLOM|nr:4281_t:CDS:2 [Ambispora gerdemannii]
MASVTSLPHVVKVQDVQETLDTKIVVETNNKEISLVTNESELNITLTKESQEFVTSNSSENVVLPSDRDDNSLQLEEAVDFNNEASSNVELFATESNEMDTAKLIEPEETSIESNVVPTESSNPKGDLLHRRPFAPTQLNLEFKKKDSDTSSNDVNPTKSLPSRIVNQTTSTQPLISPKIIELRRSESFHPTANQKADDSSAAAVNVRKIDPTSTLTPKSRRWALARGVIKSASILGAIPKLEQVDRELLARLEHENSQLPPQNSAEFLLARLEKQNELLDNDPKSVCIQSNVLKANLDTVQSLIDDITSPTTDGFNIENLNEEDDNTPTTDWEFWTALIQDYTGVAARLPHLLAAKIQQGVPATLRGLIWQSMCQASSTYLETMYSQLLVESSPYDRIIQRDLARTFPHIEMFKEEGGQGQTMLWNVLKAYSLYDPLVGYCQGLGFLVGPLLMNMNEAQAFSVFVRLMETYDMRSMFTLNMEGLQLRLYQFSSLLSQILPKLHSHFQLHAVHAAMFASQWFLSLFAYTYPLPLVLRIYDVVFAEGAPETIMRVAIALLQKNEERLLEMGEFEDLLDFLTTRLYESYDNKPTGLIKDAMGLSSVITKVKLDELSGSYLKELEEQKKRAEELVAVLPSTSTTANPATPASNTALPSPPLSATSSAMLHQQIEDLVTALSELQKEHADITEQLVNIKMEKMDLVTEVETLRSRVRDLEKEKKRMSVASSIDSAIASNDGTSPSRRGSVSSSLVTLSLQSEDTDTTPRQSTEVHTKRATITSPTTRNVDSVDFSKLRRVSAPSFANDSRIFTTRSSSSSTSNSTSDTSPTTEMSEFDAIDLSSDNQKLEISNNESAITDELIQVKVEKFELMQENDDLQKRIEELQLSLHESLDSQETLQEKNIFLRQEIARLDEEATTAVYQQHTMEKDVKAYKELKVENVKIHKENENLKTQVEALEEKVKLLQDISAGNFADRSYRRVSFMGLFGGAAAAVTPSSSPKPGFVGASGESNRNSLIDSPTSDSDYAFVCRGDCEMAKKVEEMELTINEFKLRLTESEEARESMSSQLDGLRLLINGFSEDTPETLLPIPPKSPLLTPISSRDSQRLQEKRGSRSSIVAFFSSG